MTGQTLCSRGRALFIATLLVVVSASPTWTRADEWRDVLVFTTAADEAGRTREAQFVAELRLALDGVRVLRVQPKAHDFVTKALGEQVHLVREELERHHGLAATWLSTLSEDLVLVHMVVLSSGRILVRMIEGNPRRTGFAVDLAMASRELLGTAFLFEPTPRVDRGVERVIESVRQRAAQRPLPQGNGSLLALARSGGGLAGYHGPSLLLGGQLGVELRISEGLYGRALGGLMGGPLNASGAAPDIRTRLALAGVGATYLWSMGSLRLGPVLELSPTWTSLRIQPIEAKAQTFSLWGINAELGPEVRVAFGDHAELAAAGLASWSPRRKVLRLASSRETLVATPTLAWGVSLGVVLHLP